MEDFERFDLIVTMDHANYRDMQRLAPDEAALAKVRLFRDFDPDSQGLEVPDPYYGTDDDYREMIEVIMPAAEGLVAHLQGSAT